MKQRIHVVGGGIAGLVAAIAVAEAGVPVVLSEAGRAVGGRARSTDGEWKANYGPHALYCDGAMVPWLRSHELLPRLVRPPALGFRVRVDGRLHRMPMSLIAATLRLTSGAPSDASFGDWAGGKASDAAVHAAIGLAALPTFHHDPGSLSAAFVAERLRRVTLHASAVRYVEGGWSELVARLEQRCRDLGVEILCTDVVTELPSGPVIVATRAAAAEKLLGRSLPQAGSRVALLDVGLAGYRQRAPFAVMDLDDRSYLARYGKVDRSLAPVDHELVQTSIPLSDAENAESGRRRLHGALDATLPGWRGARGWERNAVAVHGSGAVDLPGTTWRDRPAVDQGDGVFLAGDYVAAPGMLSEVSWASAVSAAAKATALIASAPLGLLT